MARLRLEIKRDCFHIHHVMDVMDVNEILNIHVSL